MKLFTGITLTGILTALIPAPAQAGYYTREEVRCENQAENTVAGVTAGAIAGLVIGGLLGGDRGAVRGLQAGATSGGLLGFGLSCQQEARYVGDVDDILSNPYYDQEGNYDLPNREGQIQLFPLMIFPEGRICRQYRTTFFQRGLPPLERTDIACRESNRGHWRYNHSYEEIHRDYDRFSPERDRLRFERSFGDRRYPVKREELQFREHRDYGRGEEHHRERGAW